MTTTSPPRRLPHAPDSFRGSIEELVERVLLPVQPPVEAVVRFHDALFGYLHGLKPTFWLEADRTWNGAHQSQEGLAIQRCDGAPATLIHALLATGAWPQAPFCDALATLPSGVAALPPGTAPARGWKRALLVPLAPGPSAVRPSRRVLLRAMVRSLHPCNQIWVPLASGARLEEDPDLRSYLVAVYKQRYRSIWAEFLSLAGDRGPLPRLEAGAVGISFPDSALPPQDVASSSREDRVAVGAHFLCPDGGKVLDFGDGTFETGAWAVPSRHRSTLRTVALHPTKATRSVRHGPVVGMRTLLVDDEERVIFRVRQEGGPVEWRGGGAGDTGYAWAVLRTARPAS